MPFGTVKCYKNLRKTKEKKKNNVKIDNNIGVINQIMSLPDGVQYIKFVLIYVTEFHTKYHQVIKILNKATICEP